MYWLYWLVPCPNAIGWPVYWLHPPPPDQRVRRVFLHPSMPSAPTLPASTEGSSTFQHVPPPSCPEAHRACHQPAGRSKDPDEDSRIGHHDSRDDSGSRKGVAVLSSLQLGGEQGLGTAHKTRYSITFH